MKILFMILLSAAASVADAQQASLVVHIDQLKSNTGVVYVTLKDSARNIVGEKKVAVADQRAEATFDELVPGEYAVRVYHDENNNGKLDRAVLGIRKESWGTSNDSKHSFGPARYKNMLFKVQGDEKITISVRN